MRWSLILIGLMASFLSPSASAAWHNESAADLPAAVKQIFRARCVECHGTVRREADIDILDLSSYRGEDGVVIPGSVDDSILYDYIASDDEDYRMPEAPRPPLTKAEIETVRRWIDAGAGDFPPDVSIPAEPGADAALAGVTGAEYVLTQILQYVQNVPRDDRAYLRFFSSNHLLTSGASAAELLTYRHALAKAINHLSWEPDIVRPVCVDEGVGTIFVVDLRDLGWQKSPFTAAGDASSSPASRSSVDLFDMVLLEYPYGLVFEHSEVFQQLGDVYLNHADLVRPIPWVRIDWFVSTATQSPLYEDLLQLPFELYELEDMLDVDSQSNLETYVARRAGMTLSGVSRNNRVVERHPSRNGAYWKSFDFETSKGLQNMFVDPINFHYAGGEMIWNLPNGTQAYFVTDTAGLRLTEAPTSIVTDKFAEDRVVRNGLACMRCHERGVKRFADNIRPAFESLPGSAVAGKADILRLYIAREDMNRLLDRDERRFLTAMREALGEEQNSEPLIPVSRTFLDAPLTLQQAAAELGLKDATGLQNVFRLPQFMQLGLAGFSAGGVIRRDTWEDYFDRIARQLGIAVPVAAVNGLTRPDHLPDSAARQLTLTTNKAGNIFAPGEGMVVTLTNNTAGDLFFELVGTSARGRKVVLTDGVQRLGQGQSCRLPQSGSITIQPQLGDEFITVFASPVKFSPGTILRGQGVMDRFLHSFYAYDRHSGRLTRDAGRLIKKTLRIQTR
ncbi:MAG: hypothetical protein NXI04_26900 [Planctomycetaceae bacterium]|nr:hypothetical protein [Planctomycetaceae bacterium]